MRLSTLVGSSFVVLLMTAASTATATSPAPEQVSGPVSHENLSVYFVHGPSKAGPVPLTLQEALAKGVAQVRETSNVNSLAIENVGDTPVFVQAGDIVKGGKQDRTLMVSLLLPPKSGLIPIASFCVEHGRWSPRGAEDAKSFASSGSAVPSREMKLAMQAPLPAAPVGENVGLRQQKVWAEVAKAQDRFAAATGADVRAAASTSSLQLALENKKLDEMRAAYVAALKAAGEASDDIVGYVFAVNGKINSAEVYESNGLFRKMWPKLLDASAAEAIASRADAKAPPPEAKAVDAFLNVPASAPAKDTPLNFGLNRTTRESAQEVMFETSQAAGGFVHRSYLAK